MNKYEVVCGDTGRELGVPLIDADGAPIPVVGVEEVALQGTSLDLPGVAFNHLGIVDVAAGEAIFSQLGSLLEADQVEPKAHATFMCRAQVTGPDGRIHTPEFALRFVRLPSALSGPEGAFAMPHPLEMSHDIRSFSYDVATIGSGGGGLPRGVRRGTWLQKARGNARDVSTFDGATANKVFEVVEDNLIAPEGGGSQPWWNRPWAYSMVQNASIGPLSAAGEFLQGIEMGSFMLDTPWQTTFASSFNPVPVCQLRFNYTRGKWEVLVWDSDTGLAPDVVDCDWQPANGLWVCDVDIKELRMDYRPGKNGVGSHLRCYLNGQLVKDYTGQRLDNCYGQGGSNGVDFRAGYFVTSGSNPASVVAETTFYSSRIWFQHWYPSPPNV